MAGLALLFLSQVSTTTSLPKSSPDEQTYHGISIDQVFEPLANHDFTEPDYRQKTFFVKTGKFEVKIDNFAPVSISKNGRKLFAFRTRKNEGEYWGSVAGVSHLLGSKSTELYVEASGPGGVCCTNYWIIDLSNGTPREIFRSEDFGEFRDPMEIFDADGDGIYELMQFDSAFRYLMDDCGSCSPEPRAVFKYDRRTGKYIPVAGIQQEFVKKAFWKTAEEIVDWSAKTRKENNAALELELSRTVLDHVVDLLYLGETQRAWVAFEKYYPYDESKGQVRAEIRARLRESRFYRSLRKQKSRTSV
jgi:hypothetical protein